MSLDAGRGFHPSLCDPEHEVAVAGVSGLFRPAQAIPREQPHLLRGDHVPHCSPSTPKSLSRIDHFQSRPPRVKTGRPERGRRDSARPAHAFSKSPVARSTPRTARVEIQPLANFAARPFPLRSGFRCPDEAARSLGFRHLALRLLLHLAITHVRQRH